MQPQAHTMKDSGARMSGRGHPPTGEGALCHIPPGGKIFAQGDRAGRLYQVAFGAVRLYRLTCDGRRQVVAFHLAGETFGLEASPTRAFFADALGATALKITPIAASDSLSGSMTAMALQTMMRAQEHVLVICRQSAVERLAAFLLDMMERQGGLEQIDLPMSRIDIAEYLGMTIETVSRSFSRLREDKTVRLHGARTVELLSPERLRRLCQ